MPTTTVIWADSLLLVNFSMDFLALYITARLLHLPIRAARLAAGAAIGATLALLAALWEPFTSVAFIGGAVVIARLALGGDWLRGMVTFCGVNIGLGGVMTALYSLIGRAAERLSLRAPEADPGTSPLLFGVIALISGAVSLLYGKFRSRTISERRVQVKLKIFGREETLEFLCDSGNLLCEPYSGRPVMIAAEKKLHGLVPPELLQAAKTPSDLASLPPELARGLCLIPAGSVMGEGMLLGFAPERAEADGHLLDTVLAIDTHSEDYSGAAGIIPEILLI